MDDLSNQFIRDILRSPDKRRHNYNQIFQNICCGYSKEPSQRDGSFGHPKHSSIYSDGLENDHKFKLNIFTCLDLCIVCVLSCIQFCISIN